MTLHEFKLRIEFSTMIYARPANGHPFMEVTKKAAIEWAQMSVNNQLIPTRVNCDKDVWYLACAPTVGEPLTP